MPEWQGAGAGMRFLNAVCEAWRRGRNRYNRPMPTLFHTSHPGLAAALQAGVPVEACPRRVEAAHVPPNIDIIIAAHAHAYITTGACHGALGYHSSLLPRHRGRDAVRWTIHMADPIAGGTAYWIDDGADTGPIAAQDWCWVRPDDTPQTLWRRELALMGLRLLAAVLADLDAGRVPSHPQDAAAATWEPSFSAGLLSGA